MPRQFGVFRQILFTGEVSRASSSENFVQLDAISWMEVGKMLPKMVTAIHLFVSLARQERTHRGITFCRRQEISSPRT